MEKIKSNTSAEYIRRIGWALEFIDTHIDQVIQLDDIAQASHFSAYHFHRIFHALVKETVNEYVSRKRMEKAICRLIHKTELSVTEISDAGGFSSSANFAKAFKHYFGLSPTELRSGQFNNQANLEASKKGKLYRKYGKAFKPQDLYSQFVTQSGVFDPGKLEDMLMKIRVEALQETPIAYLTSAKGYELESVYATWDKINHWAALQGINENSQLRFALCHDNPTITPEDKCCYEAAIVVTPDIEIAAPYKKSTIPAGQYVVAYYKDDADKIASFITELCSQWFPDSGYEPDDFPLMFKYLNDSREDGFVEMDIYLKVRVLELT